MNKKQTIMRSKSNSSSPLILEKLLLSESREPSVHSSPNAFDWEKRLAVPGGSPNAFALSMNGVQVFDYPESGNESDLKKELNQQQQQKEQILRYDVDLAEVNLMDQMVHSAEEAQNSFNLLEIQNQFNNNIEDYSESESSISSMSSLLNPLSSKRNYHDRKDSHRESERRRRETFKTAMFHLENLVILTLNRSGVHKLQGKGPNRKLAHAEVYKMARDIIVTLKEEIEKVECMNREIAYSLQK